VKRLVKMATIGAAHGVKGEVRVKSATAEPMALASYGALLADDGRAFEIEALHPAKGDMLIVKFRGIDDRDAAQALNGVVLHAERSALPPVSGKDEFYHADLIGLAAVDASGRVLGTVTAVHDFGAGDMLDIAPLKGPSLLVPFTKAAVPEVDISGGRLTVVPPAEDDGEPEGPTEKESQE
jgi:16S rRNA processing protein RimM